MIESLQSEPQCYSRRELCRTFGLSRSGLYAQGAKAQRPRSLQDQQLAIEIKFHFRQSRCTYGARRLQQMLTPSDSILLWVISPLSNLKTPSFHN